MDKQINIAYSLTDINWQLAFVSIQSVIENNKNNKLNFFIIYNSNITTEILNLFKKFNNYPNVAYIEFIYFN